jgi:hypothetical protein
MKSVILFLLIGFVGLPAYSQVNSSQAFYPDEASPENIGRKVIQELLSREGLMHFKGGAHKNMVHYAEACAGMGAVRLACSMNDNALLEKARSPVFK